jgi:16S rRNA (uracil1498-N3)-methyltransferase
MARAPRDFGAGTLDRLRRVAAAAVEQCQRSRLPEITGPHAWKEIGAISGAGPRWFLDPGATSAGPPLRDTGALLVGPEGGLAPEERAELLASGWHPVSLGERILRLETAAVVGAALLLLSPSGIQDPKLTPPAPSG